FDARISGSILTRIEDTLLSSAALYDGYELLVRAIKGRGQLRASATAPIPWPMTLVCNQLISAKGQGLSVTDRAELDDQLAEDLPDYSSYRFSPALMRRFNDTVATARRRGVEVILFLPPLSQYELELIRQSGKWKSFVDSKVQLANVSPFWDFSGYNPMS